MNEAAAATHGTVESKAGISVVRAQENYRSWKTAEYPAGLSANNVGAKELSMNVSTLPPGGVIDAHIHVGFEVGIYVLSGAMRYEYGPGLRETMVAGPGDFVFVEPGVPHQVCNVSDTEPAICVVARSAADEWDRIVPYQH
ncbi:MAG: cupin [Chloroflexi bacterium]|nr:MAG: cupin [Chloroflexota bacterium]